MNYANLESSDRLRRVLRTLKRKAELSTLEIGIRARVCAVSTAVSELRANGYAIRCQRCGDVWYYRLEA